MKYSIEQLQPGYVVKFANGALRMVVKIGKKDSLILLSENGAWDYLSDWNYNLTATKYLLADPASKIGHDLLWFYDIMEVYGFVNDTKYYFESNEISTYHRPLLWSRKPIKKMTISEIEKKLGHKVEIVSEE